MSIIRSVLHQRFHCSSNDVSCLSLLYVLTVREKAKQLVALLKDDRKLKEERAKAHTVSTGHLVSFPDPAF